MSSAVEGERRAGLEIALDNLLEVAARPPSAPKHLDPQPVGSFDQGVHRAPRAVAADGELVSDDASVEEHAKGLERDPVLVREANEHRHGPELPVARAHGRPQLQQRPAGEERVAGDRCDRADGQQAADLDIKISAGLLGLLKNDVEHLEIDITGNIKGTLREDGSTTFHDLIETNEQADATSEDAKKTDPSQALAGIGRTTIRFDQLSIELSAESEAVQQALCE